jgi:hypothetical protein
MPKHTKHTCYILRIKIAEVKTRQSFTTKEHFPHIRHIRGIEATQVKTIQCPTIVEHSTHVGHIFSVKVAQVNTFQSITFLEHRTHVDDIPGAKAAQVKTCHIITIEEHITHIGHILGIEVAYACYCLQVVTIVEPASCAGNAGAIGKGIIKNHLRDFLSIRRPTGFNPIIGNCKRPHIHAPFAFLVLVEIERQHCFVFAQYGIGFLGTCGRTAENHADGRHHHFE